MSERIGEWEVHPYACVFRLMSDDEFSSLCDSIREWGLRDPILLLDGKVLDGRNRLRACLETGTPPQFEEFGLYDSDREVRDFVWDRNAVRRHLTPLALATCRLALYPEEAESAKAAAAERKAEGQDRGRKKRAAGSAPNGAQPTDQPRTEKKAAADIAHKAGVSTRTVERATEIASAGDDLLKKAVEHPEKIQEVYKEARSRNAAKKPKTDDKPRLKSAARLLTKANKFLPDLHCDWADSDADEAQTAELVRVLRTTASAIEKSGGRRE